MKIEWLVADVTAVSSLNRAERAILGVIVAGRALANPGHFCGRGATLWCRNPLLSPKILTYGHLMKTEWLGVDVIAVGSPGRAEHAISAEEPLCGVETPSWALIPFLRIIY